MACRQMVLTVCSLICINQQNWHHATIIIILHSDRTTDASYYTLLQLCSMYTTQAQHFAQLVKTRHHI